MNVSLYQAAAALNANERWQEAIAENMASSSIPGFKRQDVSFSAIQSGIMNTGGDAATATQTPYSLPQSHPAISFAQGEMRSTNVDTDVAIEGPGFFEVQMANGDMAYTRDGEFHMDAQGQLVTKQGYAVMGETGPLQLNPRGKGTLTISADGQVSQGSESHGKLKAVDFADPQLLSHLGGSYFQVRDPQAQMSELTGATFRQRVLESANTTPAAEMVNMMSALRSYEANQKLIQVQDEHMGMSIRDLSGTS